MPTKRRASSESLESSASSPVTKKMRADSMSLETVLGLSRNALTGLPVDTLVSHILELQRAYKDVALQLANSKNEPKNAIQSKVIAAATPAMSADQVQVKADKMAKMMAAEIKKQMKWQPSCKTSGKRWTYSAMVPNTEVFLKLFGLGEEKKAWKTKKIPLEDFEEITGQLTTSIRYGYLNIISKEVTLNWKKNEQSFSVSGKYGL